MPHKPQVSVLLPLCNGLQFVEQAIESVMSQTGVTFELLIGANGPPGQAPSDEDIEYLRDLTRNKFTEHGGSEGCLRRSVVADIRSDCHSQADALNRLTEFANADLVALIDADDVWLPGKLAAQVEHMADCNLDVCGTYAEYIGDRSGTIPVTYTPTLTDFRRSNHIVNSSVMLKKSLAKWQGATLIDYRLWLLLAREGRRFGNVPRVLTQHRIHSGQAHCTNHTPEQVEAMRRDVLGE